MHLLTAIIQLAQLTHKCPLLIEDEDGQHRPHKHDSHPNEWRVLAAQDQDLSSAPFSRNNLWAEKYTVWKIKDQKWWKRRQNEFQKLLLHFMRKTISFLISSSTFQSEVSHLAYVDTPQLIQKQYLLVH